MAAGRSWVNPPPVMVVSGNEAFLREREIKRAVRAAMAKDRKVQEVNGEEPGAVSTVLAGSLLFTEAKLVLVSNPQKVDLDLLQSHHDEGDNEVCLVLHHDGKIRGNTKFGKFVASLPKWAHMEFLEPPAYKAQEQAVLFCVAEAKRNRKTMDAKVAGALVSYIGTDLGTLSFEIQKAAMYLDSLGGETEIGGRHIKKTIAHIGEGSVTPIIDAIGRADGRGALSAMRRLRTVSKSDPTMLVLGWLGRNASQWLQAACLSEMGVESKAAAQQVGVPPYVYDRFIVPVGKRWGKVRLVDLIKKVAEVERAVKSGAISPWVKLECAVLAACFAVAPSQVRRG